MNKKPVILRTVIAVLVIVVFGVSIWPLQERDFYQTFRSIWKSSDDPVLTQLVEDAKRNEVELNIYPASEALLRAAADNQVDMTALVKGKDLQNNRDVTAEVRKLSAPSIRRGLDLNGGAEFLMRIIPDAKFSHEIAAADSEAAKEKLWDDFSSSREKAIEVLRRRLESNKIFEVEIYPMGRDLLSMRVPVVSKEEKLRMLNLIKMSAQLRFSLVHPDNDTLLKKLAEDPNFKVPGYTLMRSPSGDTCFVSDRVEMTGDGIVEARPAVDQYGQRKIELRFDTAGTVDFGKVTQANLGRRLAIVLDGKLYCAPNIKSEILTGSAEITGRFSNEELNDIAQALEAGGMKYQLTEEAVFDTDPTLGRDNVTNGVWAGIGSLFLVFLFMLVYYRFGGVVASIALAVNVLMVLGSLAAFNQTLTLPGIAGIILTIGMAVDINVLIFERIREEERAGKSLAASLDTAYARVLPVVIDAYLTAFFTAMILLYFGTGAVKGFAITMTIGIFTSTFTGVFLTRLAFDYFVRFFHLSKLTMLTLVPENACVHYLKYWRQTLIAAAVLVLMTFAVFAAERSDAFSIDFTGGTMITFNYQDKVPSDSLAKALDQAGFGEARITYKSSMSAGDSQKVEILIREKNESGAASTDSSGDSLGQRMGSELNRAFPDAKFTGGQESVVSGLVGYEFSKSALLAVFIAFIGMVVYISIRYEFAYAIAALLALLCDVVISIGVYLALGRQVSLIVIAAVLTIIGYSINDKIVIFDRIRENWQALKGQTYIQLINVSINQTMARTLLTSFSTLLVLIVLLFFGGIAINDFVLVMMLGVIIGTLSSIFVACPLVALWHRSRVGVKDAGMTEAAGKAEDSAAR